MVAATFPFQTGREVAFTNAKLLERKEVDMGSMDGENRVKFTLLPTGFLTAQLDEKRPLDRRLLADSISLSRVDQLASGHQDPSVIQQLMLKAKVLDIGAIRPCQTPMYVHRQVILLGEADETKVPRIPLGATPNTQRMTQGLHLMVLWDDQVALSRLFRVGDTLSIFHPFVHVCDQHDTEILHILNEYSSQQRLMYYFEYGSATVLFCQPCRIATTKSPIKNRPVSQGPSEIERPLSRLADIKPGWRNFSLYAHVRNIKVSHGIPLLAAFFYAYYDPKTNQSGAMNSSMQQPPPPLDRTIVSKYYLVVMLQVYLPSSKRLMTIEITGENALIALRLVPGQSVFLDGLVAIDMKSKPVRRFRERALMPSASLTASAPVEFAFPTKTYSNSSDSGVVVLCSDWASIFGKQSLFSTNSNLTVVNTTPGLMNTVLDQSKALDNASAHALKMVEMTVTGAGWLIPSSNGYTIDSTCEKGHSTTCAHKFCLRSLETIPREQRAAAPPKWKCSFCQEVFFGMEDTVQTYQDLAVTVETGKSQTSPLILLCQGDTVENLLGLPAEDYVQLSLAEKRKTLDSVTGSAFRLMLSRCEALHVSLATTPSPSSPRSFDTSSSIDFRMDMAQLVDTFAAAHQLLATLGFQTDQAF
ncbi:hypothetical protein P3T76_007410 [Phytophthora citrophthora]|uniref:Cell division control protein 24 OB domain-containing protein n=1 Tax=Phytophthora citrophthora TaxID=4793 RepID=A0AAD9LNX1_9STRA|nr:hypothetical protein P3T76_007410 [Phytophthora citrophthora]